MAGGVWPSSRTPRVVVVAVLQVLTSSDTGGQTELRALIVLCGAAVLSLNSILTVRLKAPLYLHLVRRVWQGTGSGLRAFGAGRIHSQKRYAW